MPIPYLHIARAIALRSNQIDGGDSADREAAYSGFTVASMDGVEVPYTALKDVIIQTEAELAEMVGYKANSAHRQALAAVSDDLADGDEIPTLDESNKQFVGIFDGVFDSETDDPLDYVPFHLFTPAKRNYGSFFRTDRFEYSRVGTLVYTSRPSIYFRGCSWDHNQASGMFDSMGISPLPYALAALWICKGLSILPIENWFVQEAGYYRDLAAAKEDGIIEGTIQMSELPDVVEKKKNQ